MKRKRQFCAGCVATVFLGQPLLLLAADDSLDALFGAEPAAPAAPAAAEPAAAPAAPAAADNTSAAVPAAAAPADAPVPLPADTAASSAATTGKAKSPNSVKNRVIEEIVVTSQKREERLQDVPLSVQAFSGDAMAARGIATTQQLGITVPSATFTTVAGYTLIFIRGIGTDNFIPSADPSVATYVDGIYVPSGHETAQSLGNIERVEILKGPQGTLFGRNATGGAISIVTQEPGEELHADAEGTYGRFNHEAFKLNVSGPVTSWFSAGASGLIDRSDSYYKDINYAVEPNSLQALRVKLNFHPLENLSLALTGFRTKQGSVNGVIGNNTDPSLVGRGAGIQPQKDSYTSNIDLNQESKASQNIYYGNLTWKAPWFDIKLLGAYEHILTEIATLDFDGSDKPLASFDAENQGTFLRTAELQIVSNAETPFAERLKWIAGLYYQNSQAGFPEAHLRAAPGALVSYENVFGVSSPLFNTLVAAVPGVGSVLLSDGIQVRFTGLLRTESASAFTQGTLKATDWLDFTLGVRAQQENRSIVESSIGFVNPFTGNDVPLLPFSKPGHKAANIAPKAVIGVHPGENQLLYFSYSVGFKSGTYNVVNIYTQPNYIVPEKVDAYELGAKLDFLDGGLRVNGALFHNTIHNLQSGFVSLLSGGAVQFFTVPEAVTKGVEFDATWVPLPVRDPGLAITANAAYVEAKYTNFPKGPGFAPTTGIYSNNLSFTGNEIVRSPKFSGDLGLVQSFDLGDNSTLELATDAYFNSGFYYDSQNSVREPAYAIVNAHGSLQYKPWKARATVYGQNLLSRGYHIQQFQTDFGVKKTLAEPIEVGIRLAWEF